MNINKYYIDSLFKKYEYELASAVAGLTVYLSDDKISAIGEHSDLITEQDKFLTKMVEAKDKLQMLDEFLIHLEEEENKNDDGDDFNLGEVG